MSICVPNSISGCFCKAASKVRILFCPFFHGVTTTLGSSRCDFQYRCSAAGNGYQPSSTTNHTGRFVDPLCLGETPTFPALVPDILLDEGSDLSAYGVSARTIAVLGNTAGMIALLTDKNEAISADCFAGHPFSTRKPSVMYLHDDREQAAKSLRKLAAMNLIGTTWATAAPSKAPRSRIGWHEMATADLARL